MHALVIGFAIFGVICLAAIVTGLVLFVRQIKVYGWNQ